MEDPLTRPTLCIRFECADGELLQRDLSYNDLQVEGGHAVEKMLRDGPPEWITEPGRAWPDPQGPITFTGKVVPGREDEARAVVNA